MTRPTVGRSSPRWRSTRTSRRWPCRVTVTPAEPPRDRPVTPGLPLDTKNQGFLPSRPVRTILAGPDIAEARRPAASKRCTAGRSQLGRAIRPWAEWSIAAQDDPATAVARMALKHQGRAVAASGPPAPGPKNRHRLSTNLRVVLQDVYVPPNPNPRRDHRPGRTKIPQRADKTVTTPTPPPRLGRGVHPRRPQPGLEPRRRAGRAVRHRRADRRHHTLTRPAASQMRRGGPTSHRDGITETLETVNAATAPLRLRRDSHRTLESPDPSNLVPRRDRRWSGVPDPPNASPTAAMSMDLRTRLANATRTGPHRHSQDQAAGWIRCQDDAYRGVVLIARRVSASPCLIAASGWRWADPGADQRRCPSRTRCWGPVIEGR